MSQNERSQKSSERTLIGFLSAVILCLIFAVVFLMFGGVMKPAPSTELAAPVQAAPTEPASAETVAAAAAQIAAPTAPSMTVTPASSGEPQQELSITDLLKAILTLKKDLKDAIEDMGEGNLELAEAKFKGIADKTVTVRGGLDATVAAMGESMPSLQKQMLNAKELLNLVDLAVDRLMIPTVHQLGDHPIDGITVGTDGINTKILCEYLDYLETLMPDIEELVTMANGVDLSLADSDGDLAEYLEQFNAVLEVYKTDPSVLSKLKEALGGSGDRLYVIAAQNSAEIRASGGFPGAIGTIQISNGVMTIGEFKKVYDVFASSTPASANLTLTEGRLFHYGLSAPRDADYCPDFERVGYIFALGYETKMNTQVDGVISLTPAIVQRMLDSIDEEITLFDGLVLNGYNASRILQHDLYFNYFGAQYVDSAMNITDQLFADAAKKSMTRVLENMSAENLLAFLSVAKDSIADRTLMFWMKDEATQELIKKLGWSGGLNHDPQNPQAGIYYNCTIASKMGWFLVVDAEIGEGVRNADGSYTYPMTVTFSNDMSQEELKGAQAYITGGQNGVFVGSTYFFAPAGGSVSDFSSTGNMYFQMDNYNGLDLGYVNSFSVSSGKPITVTYNVTTAPGVDTPLVISQTPTMQEYH